MGRFAFYPESKEVKTVEVGRTIDSSEEEEACLSLQGGSKHISQH